MCGIYNAQKYEIRLLMKLININGLLGPTLQELFLKWSHLSKREKILLNYVTYYIIEKKQMELYSPIIQGFSYWNSIQDIEGNFFLWNIAVFMMNFTSFHYNMTFCGIFFVS